MRVLWVDDELYYLESFFDEFREDERVTVHDISDINEALDLLEKDYRPDLLIWDMIMPPGRLGLSETEKGMRTGAVFFSRFREKHKDVPAILFTNVSVVGIHQRYDDPQSLSWAFEKRELLPDELLERCWAIVEQRWNES